MIELNHEIDVTTHADLARGVRRHLDVRTQQEREVDAQASDMDRTKEAT